MLVGDWTAASPPWHRMHVHRTTLVPLLCLAVGLTVTASATASAAEERPRVRVVWTDTPPEIDGHLDDEVWKTAALVDRLTQVVPVEGAEPSQHTEIRILTTKEALYFGIRAHDTEPERIIAKRMLRDLSLIHI